MHVYISAVVKAINNYNLNKSYLLKCVIHDWGKPLSFISYDKILKRWYYYHNKLSWHEKDEQCTYTYT